MLRYAGKLGWDMILPYYPLCLKHNLYDVYDMLYELYKKLLTEFRAENIAFLGGSSGGNELFAAAASSLKKRLEECGVKVTLEIGEGMYHCYSVMPFVSEARQGYNNMINYLKNNISGKA